MKNKGILGIALCLFSTVALSDCEFNVGIGTGHQSADFKQKAFIVRTSPFPITNFNVIDKTHLSGKGPFGSLFAGLAWRFTSCNSDCEDFYLGLEGNIDTRSLKFHSSNREFLHVNFNQTTYKMTRDYGVSVLPGYLYCSNTLFYARLGHAKGRFKVFSTENTLEEIRKNLNGIRYGVGIRQTVMDCFAVRMDFSRIQYKHARMRGFDPVGFTTKVTDVAPRVNKFEVDLMYLF